MQRPREDRVAISGDENVTACMWRLSGTRSTSAPLEPPSHAVPVSVLNISGSGMAVSVETVPGLLEPGDCFGLVLERARHKLVLEAEVRHEQKLDARSVKLGLRFVLDPLSPADQRQRERIEFLLAELQAERASARQQVPR